MRKTNFPANNRQSNALPASSNGKKSISPDESFFDDILNFEEEEEEDTEEDPSLLTPPRKSKPRDRDLARPSPRQPVNRSNNNKELRRPFSGSQQSTKPPSPGVSTVDSSGVRLSLFEFGHIRSQETKAELECDHADNPGLRLDLETGRVCFCCQNVRFRMLNWAYSCQLCRRNVKYFPARRQRRGLHDVYLQVCSNCYIKLSLPMENLREVAVASLISQLSPVKQEDSESLLRSSLSRISLRRSNLDKRKTSTPAPALPSASASATYRPRMLR